MVKTRCAMKWVFLPFVILAVGGAIFGLIYYLVVFVWLPH